MRTHDERNNGLREHSAFHLHPHPIKEQKRTETQLPPTAQTARPPRFIHSLVKKRVRTKEEKRKEEQKKKNKTKQEEQMIQLYNVNY